MANASTNILENGTVTFGGLRFNIVDDRKQCASGVSKDKPLSNGYEVVVGRLLTPSIDYMPGPKNRSVLERFRVDGVYVPK